MNTEASPDETREGGSAIAVPLYLVAFVTGAIVMSFEMLGSRYLAPSFGAGIYTWASLISTVLAALCLGYFIGGYVADRYPSPTVLGATVAVGSVYLLALPAFAEPVVQFFVWQIDDIKLGSLAAALAIMLFPVTFLGMYSPFAIRLLLHSKLNSGAISGTVYGISTAGSILGTLATTFYLIPLIGTRAITLTLGVMGLLAGALLVFTASSRWRRRAQLGVLAALLASQAAMMSPVRAEDPFDPKIRAAVLARKNGLIERIEGVYNDIFVAKLANVLKLSFQWKGWFNQESEINLADPYDLPLLYARVMTLAAIYPQDIKRVLVVGLGGGAIPVYLDHFLPDATIDSIELDPGVIGAAKKYFGLRETSRFHIIEGDGRLYLNRHAEPYDIIMIDAFTGSYIPFHLMTKEFYQLLRDRLAPRGVVVFNFFPSEKLFDSNVRTLKLVFGDNLDFFDSGEPVVTDANAIVVGRLDPATSAETLQKAAAAQARYKFRFDVSRLVADRRIPVPKPVKGDVLTDDFAPADVLDANGRRYRREK